MMCEVFLLTTSLISNYRTTLQVWLAALVVVIKPTLGITVHNQVASFPFSCGLCEQEPRVPRDDRLVRRNKVWGCPDIT
jgi:hypothetical protein